MTRGRDSHPAARRLPGRLPLRVLAASMLSDMRAALARGGGRTGIAFRDVPFGTAADLVLNWAPLADYDPGTQAAA